MLTILPGTIRNLMSHRIHQTEEIVLDKGQNLEIRLEGLRIEYPMMITSTEMEYVANKVGKFRDDGRRSLSGTLHRVSGDFDENELVDKITIRVARVIMGVAEPLRTYIEAANGICVIAPPAVVKTTLLRDIARIRSEVLSSGLIVIDSSNEITGDGDLPHPMMSRVRRFKVGDPTEQAPKLKRAIRNHGPEELLMDEVGYTGDVPPLESASRNGLTVIATMHGKIVHDVLENPPLLPLLGLAFDERSGALVKRAKACLDTAIEVGGKGKYLVRLNLDEMVIDLLNGNQRPGIQVGNWPELSQTRATL